LDHSGCEKPQQKPKEAPDDEANGLNCVRLAVKTKDNNNNINIVVILDGEECLCMRSL